MNNNNNTNDNYNFNKQGINDAPRATTLEQATAWTKGYNDCLDKTNAKGLLSICEKLLSVYNNGELKLLSDELDELELVMNTIIINNIK